MRWQSALSMSEFSGMGTSLQGRRTRKKKSRRTSKRGKSSGRWTRAARRPAANEDVTDAEYVEVGPQQGATRWGPMVPLGSHIQIQSAEGYRAAVVELKPGLFIVAEIPEHVTRSEFGFLPLLAPLVIRAAAKAIKTPPKQRMLPKLLAAANQSGSTTPTGLSKVMSLAKTLVPGAAPVAAMVPRAAIAPSRLVAPSVAMVPRAAVAPSVATPPHCPLTPISDSAGAHNPSMVRATALPSARSMAPQHALIPANTLLPPPVVGEWLDDEDLASVIGCDQCKGRCGR